MEKSDLVAQFNDMDTTCLADALDRLGLRCGCEGILPLFPGARAAGTAFTVRYRPCGIVKGTVGDLVELADIFKGCFFFFWMWIIVLAIILLFPQLSLWLPGLIKG